MRSRFRRSANRRFSNKNPAAAWAPMQLASQDTMTWNVYQPNLLYDLAAAPEARSDAKRVLIVNADQLATGEGSPDVTVKKLDIEMVFMAGIAQAMVNSVRTAPVNQAVRDDIPLGGGGDGYTDGTSLNGALLSGHIHSASGIGPTSQVEGLPLRLFLMYEDVTAADTPQVPYDYLSTQIRNKRVFWQTIICPTLFRPERVRIRKTFPGRGVALRTGPREIYQLTLGVQAFTGMGDVVVPAWTFALGDARAMFFEAATG